MKSSFRNYLGEEDDQTIREFLARVYVITKHPYYSVDPSNWERMRISMRQSTNKSTIQLWEEDGDASKRLVGLGIYEKHRNKYSYLVDSYCDGEIEKSICDWVEAEHRGMKNYSEKIAIACSVCEKNHSQKDFLSRRGYSRGVLDTVFRKRSLIGFKSKVVLPSGYHIISGQEMFNEFLALRTQIENQVFDRTITIEFLKELRKTPLYRPELDLVIIAPDKNLAVFCTIWFDNLNKVGYIEPIGTETDNRRRGLAKALLFEGFQRLQKLGAETVYLGHMADNSAGNHLYESVEMPVFDQEYLWYKVL